MINDMHVSDTCSLTLVKSMKQISVGEWTHSPLNAECHPLISNNSMTCSPPCVCAPSQYPFLLGLGVALSWSVLVCVSRVYMGMHSVLVSAGLLHVAGNR